MCIRDRFFQAEDGIRDLRMSRGLGDVYKRQPDINQGVDRADPLVQGAGDQLSLIHI
ncbi:hypothetical protein JMUB7530_27980 [Staphylococcus aureus]